MRIVRVAIGIPSNCAWLPGFVTAYNTRFGRDPANAKICIGRWHQPIIWTRAWPGGKSARSRATWPCTTMILHAMPLTRGLVDPRKTEFDRVADLAAVSKLSRRRPWGRLCRRGFRPESVRFDPFWGLAIWRVRRHIGSVCMPDETEELNGYRFRTAQPS